MILFFDTETTGLPKNWDAPVTDLNNWPRMVQLAYLLFDINGNKILGGNYIVKPNGFKIPVDATRIHGISNERAIEEGIELKTVLQEFERHVEKATYIVAHNISFDTKIIGAEFLRNGMTNSLLTIKKICTMRSSTNFCAIQGSSGYKWPKLSELHYKLFKTRFEEAHNAAIDITVTAKCFWELKNRGVITLQNDVISSQIETIKNTESSEISNLGKLIEEDCKANNLKEIPIGAKAEALMYLNLKFKQLDVDTNIDEEFIFLLDFWRTNDSNLFKTTVNILQKEFISLTVKAIIEEHKSLSIFSDEKNKTIEDEIMQFEVLSLLNKANVKESYRNLVVHLYSYYLSAYRDFLSDSNKPKDYIEFQKDDYSNVSDVAKRSHELFNKLISEYCLQLDHISNGDLPESVYNLVNSCNKELIIIGSELGHKHKLYSESSTLIVELSVHLLSNWVQKHNALLNLSIQGMKLGNTPFDVCNTAFEAIYKIEMDDNMKEWYNIRKLSFDTHKQSLEPKSGCYIATMTYGSYDHPQVLHLRKFRDEYLQTTSFGRLFIRCYYTNSPKLVDLCKDSKILIKISRICLDTFVNKVLRKETK